jgi:large subunit ribosomal protein L17
MRHRQTTPQLGRTPAHRKALLRNMVTDFFRHEKIRTTQAKAKALRPYAEKLITMGKKDNLTARRQAARFIRDKGVLKKLFDELAPRYADRPGGYTRIIKLSSRAGDHAQMAIIEMVEAEMTTRTKRKKPKYAGPLTAVADLGAKTAVLEEVESSDEAAEEVEAAAEVSGDADAPAADAAAGDADADTTVDDSDAADAADEEKTE